jgi:hypothetical protein
MRKVEWKEEEEGMAAKRLKRLKRGRINEERRKAGKSG